LKVAHVFNSLVFNNLFGCCNKSSNQYDKTAGIAIPINGTKIEGKRVGKSDGIIL